MNGRVFDPTSGRFLSADPYIDGPETSLTYLLGPIALFAVVFVAVKRQGIVMRARVLKLFRDVLADAPRTRQSGTDVAVEDSPADVLRSDVSSSQHRHVYIWPKHGPD